MQYIKTDTLLKLENISLKYGEKLILRDINLEIKDIIRENTTTGQIITLLGRSGIGKSQLFSLIAGLNNPTTGKISVGRDQKSPEAGLVGLVMQTYPLFQHRTVISNLNLVSKDKNKIEQYLVDFGMFEHKTKYAGELSGGQRQRIAIIQQLLSSDHFILFDEPLASLDMVGIKNLCNLLNKIASYDEQNTIIISTHIIEPALAISDTAIMLGKQEGLEGATIINQYNLLEMGLAYNPKIRKDINFINLVNEINDQFK